MGKTAQLYERLLTHTRKDGKQSMDIWRIIRIGVAVLCGSLAIVILCVSLGHSARVVAATSVTGRASAVTDQVYVFRFDPVVKGFETFTIPTTGAAPYDVEVVPGTGNVNVWFTESGADRVGRLVYTNTTDYVFQEYQVSGGSKPLNLAVDGDYVWFTAYQGGWIGRLAVASGNIVTFPVPTVNSRPADIDVAPNGSVWFTEMAADKIGRLVVTTTSDYAVKEYPVTGTGTGVGVYGIAVQSNEYVWVCETGTGIARRLKVADGSYVWTAGLGSDGYPYALVMDHGRNYLWLTERNDNQISQIELGTLYIANSFDITPTFNARPTGLTMLGSDQFWFSAKGSGQIGRMAYTSSVEYNFEVFTLPVSGLWAMDIVADQDGYLWTVAYAPERVFLPVAVKNR
jgi:virginiamycin B lyase